MTASNLLFYITAALLLQLVSGLGLIVWRNRALVGGIPKQDEAAVPKHTSGAWSGWRDFRVTSRQFEDAAESQCSFLLHPVDNAPLTVFKPGQYLTFSIPIAKLPDGPERNLVRCYSLSDQPDTQDYRITIKRMLSPGGRPDLPPGAASSHFHDGVQVGDVLRVKAPSGHFFIDEDNAEPAVFIAGGIGITPMFSMLRWWFTQQPTQAAYLFYGVRNCTDYAFKTALESLAKSCPAFKLTVFYSKPGPDDILGRDYQFTGFINFEQLRSTLPHGRYQFYVCGPPPMMQSLIPALRAWGVKEDDIHFESFGTTSTQLMEPLTNEPLRSPALSFDVQFNRSGRTLVWDNRDANLLDFAERQGVVLDSGCRTGSCGSCETALVSGEVYYVDKPDYDIAAGHCLLCVGKPKSALVLEA